MALVMAKSPEEIAAMTPRQRAIYEKRVANLTGKGRPKGTPNKPGPSINQDLMRAYKELGGVEFLKSLDEKTAAGLISKLIDKKMDAEDKAVAHEEWLERLAGAL